MWIQTYLGKKFYLWDPQYESIFIEDIAHALSNVCRFAGHCKEFYSVAQHSVLLSLAVEKYVIEHQEEVGIKKLNPREMAFRARMHDASEAYVGDVTTSLKQMLPKFQQIEGIIQNVIEARFNIKVDPQNQLINNMDNAILLTEMQQLMSKPPEEWETISALKPLDLTIIPDSSIESEMSFLDRFDQLFFGEDVSHGLVTVRDIPVDSKLIQARLVKDSDPHCLNCNRERLTETEGRVIGGDWDADKTIPQHFGGWVCNDNCYKELLEKSA